MPADHRDGDTKQRDTAKLVWLDVWLDAFEGLDDERINIGMSRLWKNAKFADFPPSPQKFRELCLPTLAEMKWPTTTEAYRAATHGEFWHNAVYTAARICGTDWLRTKPENVTRKEFAKVYEQLRIDYLDGKDLDIRPMPVKPENQIEHVELPQAEKDRIAQEALKELREIGHGTNH